MNAKFNYQSYFLRTALALAERKDEHKENRPSCAPLCVKQFITFLIALAAMTVSTTSAWAQTESIKYLDYDQYPYYNTFSEASHDATKITSSSTNVILSDDSDDWDDWYYVEGNVTISGKVTLTNTTYLILCDDATLTINPSSGRGINTADYDLTIYAQSSGSHKGKLIINNSSTGIYSERGVTINGGDISVTSTDDGIDCALFDLNGGALTVNASASSSCGIYSYVSDVTINGGKLSATGTNCGILTTPRCDVYINGGQVTATGGTGGTGGTGISSGGDIKLGWTNASDYIEVSGYDGPVYTNAGKSFNFEDGGTLTADATLTDEQKTAIANKKLTPNTTASHTITLGTGITGGTIEVDKTKAFENERVAITVDPDYGQILASLTYTYQDGTNTKTVDITTKQANDYVITMPTANVTVNATFATPVASVTISSTTTYYANLVDTDSDPTNDAMSVVNNSTSDVTMTLCKDVTGITTGLDFFNNKKVNEGTPDERPVEITLDLNGHKLSSTSHDVVWLEGGVLTIMDSGTGGEISATGSNAICIYYNGKLTINGGTISSVNCTALNNDGNSSTPGSITINGGAISANGDHIYGIDNNGTLTINGGTITANGSDSHGIRNKDCSLTINGGTISATGSGSSGIYSEGISGSHATITIKGGTISGQNLGIYNNQSEFFSYVDVNISGGTIKSNADGISIDANSTLTLSALPTFDCVTDIYLKLNKLIVFSADVTPASNYNIKVGITDYATLPFKLTDGYAAHVKDANSQPIAPADFFTYVGTKTGSIVSFNGEAYFNTTAPAASVTASSVTTDYWTLQAAFDAVPNGGATTIDILRDITEATTARGDWDNPNITLNLNGKDVTIGGMTSLASLSIYGNGGKMTVKNNLGISNSNGDNADQLLIDKATIIIEDGIQWMALNMTLQNYAQVTVKGSLSLGYADENEGRHLTYTIDNTSWMKLISCAIGASNENQAKAALQPLVCPDLREAFTVPGTYGTDSDPYYLRGSWGIILESGLGEISAGVPKAAVTFYDGGTSFDPTAFNPSAYTTSTLYVDNSNGQDRYVIAHIVPELFYWTDLSLLSAVETGTSLTGDANALILLKRDQYDAANAGEPADMRDRYDGAGWYYYTLPKGHSVAAGYTTSTLGGEVVPRFDLDHHQTVFTYDLDNNVNTLTISRPNIDTWTATLTYDKLTWKFGGSFALSDLPKLQSISFKKGDTEMFSQNDADALAGQIENAYEIEQVRIGENLLKLRAIIYGCFVQSDYFLSKYKVLVPFDGDGSTANPWQINTAADLSLLAKCVNVGAYTFNGETLAMGNNETYDMSGSDFEPIGTDSNLPFCGTLLGNGSTIKNISYVFAGPSAVSDETQYGIGFIGNLGDPGEPLRSGNVDNIKLENCSFSSSDGDIGYVGSIAGAANRGSVSNCYVIGGNVSAPKAGSHTGAIVGKLGAATLTNNYYDYTTTATLGSSTASGYTKRGLWMGTASSDGGPTTYAWNDFTLNDGAVLWVKKVTISETKPTGSTSSVAFSQTTKGVNRYDKDGDNFYYAVNQPLTLTVTEGQSTADGLCTFYDGLSSLTVNGSSDGVDLANRSFSMPEADATIAATFTSSDWFTIPSNGKMWMSFYHEWKDANNEPVNYTVTAYGNTSNSRTRAVTNQLELLTIKKDGIDLDAGTATTLDLGGISFNGVPTLLHQEGGLPERLRFDPVAGQTAPQYDPQFVGGVSDLSPYTQKSVFMLFNSELVRADLSGDASGGSITADPHRAFVVVSDAPATSRLMLISDDATGIHSIDKLTTDDADGAWYGIDGRRLQGKPTKRGLYIVNGKKVVIK